MITTRNAVLSDALAHLRDAEDVFVRLALSRDETDHTILRTLIIDVLPPSWLAHHDDELLRPWLEDQYIAEANAAFFYCGLLRSSIVAGWFSEPQECRLTGFDDRPGHSTRSLRFALPDVHDSVTAWWGTSHAATGAKAIPYPSTLYAFHLKTTRAGQLRDDDPLVGEGGLYFPNFRVARAELMFGLTDRNQAVLREDLLAVRVVHAEGWLKKIHVLPDKVTATIAGTQVIGKAYVAIQGSGLRARKEVFGRHVSLDLPSKLPDQVELLLLSDKLLDHAEFTALEHPSPRKSPQVVVERADVFGYETPLQEEEPRMASEAPLPSVGTIQPSSSKVFVSYSHDTPEHRRRVRDLVTRLRSEGIDCRLDRYEANPSKGWQKWMEAQIAWAEYVLVVCTETYCRRFIGEESPGKGLGATWEGMIITEELYERAGDNDKFIPIVFTTVDAAFIPISLRLTTRYRVSDEVEYEKLYPRLTNQPYEETPPLGTVRQVKPARD